MAGFVEGVDRGRYAPIVIASLRCGSPNHGATVKWKLWTRNDIIGKGFDEYISKDAALERARDIIRQPHVKVLYIEEPDGKRIELEAIEAWCKG